MAEAASEKKCWICKDRVLDYSNMLVMGIVNVTPDSFSDGGLFYTPDHALKERISLISARSRPVREVKRSLPTKNCPV